MRSAIAIALMLARAASVAAQGYQSPVPAMPPGPIDTRPAYSGSTSLPPANTSATAQTPPQTAKVPPAAASTQQK